MVTFNSHTEADISLFALLSYCCHPSEGVTRCSLHPAPFASPAPAIDVTGFFQTD